MTTSTWTLEYYWDHKSGWVQKCLWGSAFCLNLLVYLILCWCLYFWDPYAMFIWLFLDICMNYFSREFEVSFRIGKFRRELKLSGAQEETPRIWGPLSKCLMGIIAFWLSKGVFFVFVFFFLRPQAAKAFSFHTSLVTYPGPLPTKSPQARFFWTYSWAIEISRHPRCLWGSLQGWLSPTPESWLEWAARTSPCSLVFLRTSLTVQYSL